MSHPVYGVDHPIAGAHVRLDNLGLDTATVNLVSNIMAHVSTMWSLIVVDMKVNMVIDVSIDKVVYTVNMVNTANTSKWSTWSR